MAIEDLLNNTVEKVYFKSRNNGKDKKSGLESSTKSVTTFHKCDKEGHTKRNFKSNRNGSDGELSER